jgi:tellurite resistance-related uncharacterized protein
VSRLPDGVTAYKRTPTFDETSVPDGLRRDHATKAGVWGLIHIEAGRLRYEVAGGQSMELSPQTQPGVIEPQVRHRVEPIGNVSFYVEFFR